jgi:hypothetical protein
MSFIKEPQPLTTNIHDVVYIPVQPHLSVHPMQTRAYRLI